MKVTTLDPKTLSFENMVLALKQEQYQKRMTLDQKKIVVTAEHLTMTGDWERSISYYQVLSKVYHQLQSRSWVDKVKQLLRRN